MQHIAHLTLLVVFVACISGCNRESTTEIGASADATKSIAGVYQTNGEDFSWKLDLRDGGLATVRCTFKDSSGKMAEDSFDFVFANQLADNFSIKEANWTVEGKLLTVKRVIHDSVPKTGPDGQANPDAIPLTHKFTIQDNGDFIVEGKEQRLYRVR